MDIPLGVVLSFDYIVKDNAQKINLVPIPPLKKEKASQNGNINP